MAALQLDCLLHWRPILYLLHVEAAHGLTPDDDDPYSHGSESKLGGPQPNPGRRFQERSPLAELLREDRPLAKLLLLPQAAAP